MLVFRWLTLQDIRRPLQQHCRHMDSVDHDELVALALEDGAQRDRPL